MKTAISHRGRTVAALVFAGLLLAGCGNDPTRGEGAKTVFGVVKGLLPGQSSAAATAPTLAPEPLAIAARQALPGSIWLGQVESLSKTATVLGEYGRNGNAVTYATTDERSFVIRDGVLIATRGFGFDLMSADTAEASRLIRARQSGEARRTWRHLDGEGIERPLRMTCTITAGGAHSYSFAGNSYATRHMIEKCAMAGLAIENAYWVTADGTITLSRQWIGPDLGHMTLQLVRR